MAEICEQDVVLPNGNGLHMRPATALINKANEFRSEISISKGDHAVNGKSIMELLTLAAPKGTSLRIRAEGEDARSAVDAIVELIEDGFGESP